MTTHNIGTRANWLAARLDLLEAEKALTERSDAIAQQRQQLPWVKVDKPYLFDTDGGRASLAGLFKGRSQLIVYHFMFGPDFKSGCPSCSSIADGFNGVDVHLENHDVAFSAVSLAPLARLQTYKQRMSWGFAWASSAPSDFNADFDVSFTELQQHEQGIDYNFRHEGPLPKPPAASITRPRLVDESPVGQLATMTGTDSMSYMRERPGMSAFALQDGVVYHTYSTYSRGVDSLWGVYQWLDRAPLGRNEDGVWWRRRDEYAAKAG